MGGFQPEQLFRRRLRASAAGERGQLGATDHRCMVHVQHSAQLQNNRSKVRAKTLGRQPFSSAPGDTALCTPDFPADHCKVIATVFVQDVHPAPSALHVGHEQGDCGIFQDTMVCFITGCILKNDADVTTIRGRGNGKHKSALLAA